MFELYFFFFFQAEDGIRDGHVTGVQTCALPILTPEVEKLRDGFDLPGIRVLQFGFGWDPAQTHLPHNYPKRSLAATGTHDNDTSRGWYDAIDNAGTRDWIHRYLKTDGRDIAWVMIRAVHL